MIKVIIPAQLLLKATSAGTVDNAGIETTATSVTGNIDMWRHPKYYKELRKRNKSDQVISETKPTGERERAPDQGLSEKATSPKSQASSNKHKSQATSNKPQATED